MHEHFSEVIFKLRKRCTEIEKQKFLSLQDNHTAITRKEFVTLQNQTREDLSVKLQNFSRDSRQDFRDGIKKILDNLKRKVTNETNNEDILIKNNSDTDQKRMYTAPSNNFGQDNDDNKKVFDVSMQKDQAVKMKTSDADRVYEDLGFKPNLKYGGKSNLRKECSRFLRFAYLLDFVTMEALTNIYLNSVQFLVDKLHLLSNVTIEYEFDTSISQFGESKRVILTGPEPLFMLDGEFREDQIKKSDLVPTEIKKFNPPPLGTSTSDDFDPIVHLEIEEEKEYESEQEEDLMDKSDEDSKHKIKYVCPNIHKLWIKLEPSKTNFTELLDESINQGYASLKVIERWSRHGELLKYVKVLESWDDKV